MANPFKPTAGATPPLLVGRNRVIEEFLESLDDGPGAPGLLELITGARGVGKTVMLTALGDSARERGWVVVDETAREGLMDRLAAEFTRQLSQLAGKERSRLTSLSLSTPLGGGSATLEHAPAPEPSWRQKARALTQWLAEHGTGLLLTIDEVHAIPREELRALSAEVQHLIREGAPIGLLMAGLPKAVEELLNDDITTFLRRAERIELGEVAIDDVCEALKSTFDTGAKALSNDLAQECANATGGYPFMIQLVGYQVWKHSGDGPVTQPAVAAGTTAARLRLGNLVHAPALRDLSDVDRTMLVCMAKDDGPSQITTSPNAWIALSTTCRSTATGCSPPGSSRPPATARSTSPPPICVSTCASTQRTSSWSESQPPTATPRPHAEAARAGLVPHPTL